MSTYKLEETPDTYISPCIDPYDRFVYRMVHFDGESNWRVIRNIDLRKDELIVHGTRINESLLEKLQSSLVLRPRTGKVYVNANGACYIVVTGKGIFRPINNIIFDWSPFGVIVPNSVNHSLRKQVQQKDQELAAMSTLLISSAKGDASADMASLEALKKEMEEFKQLLLIYRKDQEDMKIESREVCSKLHLKEFEFEETKIEFESFKEEVKNLHEQLYSSKKESEDMQTKVQNMQDQLCSVEAELQSIKIELQSSKTTIEELEYSCYSKIKQLEEDNSSCRKESEAKEAELVKVEDQLSLIINELQQSINIFFEYIDDKDLDDNKSGRCYVIKAIDIIDE